MTEKKKATTARSWCSLFPERIDFPRIQTSLASSLVTLLPFLPMANATDGQMPLSDTRSDGYFAFGVIAAAAVVMMAISYCMEKQPHPTTIGSDGVIRDGNGEIYGDIYPSGQMTFLNNRLAAR